MAGGFLLDPQTPVSVALTTRFREASSGKDQTLLRASTQRVLTRNVSTGLLLSYNRTSGSYEARPWQQFAVRWHGVVLRTQMEERLIEGADRAELRIRPRIQYGTRVARLYVVSSAEWTYRIQSHQRGDDSDPAYWRVSTSVSKPLWNGFEGAAGYMVMYRPRHGEPDRISHIPQITISRRF
ncbi:hypothetical protein GCM10010990_16660 [Croceicoccus mobilis]|uniref:DUF2490 domain-containing protein n=2 Tax=Croceicoccus mobilis TaxID=1703339 RepID=A0A916YZW5_9SPHN|nr:hypothetical protein GCM10010990_16660 [Croceicoccus mobilis]